MVGMLPLEGIAAVEHQLYFYIIYNILRTYNFPLVVI